VCDFVCDFVCDLHANRKCDFVSAVASTVDMKSHLRFAENCACYLQRIAHEIAYEIARVISPLVFGWVTAQMTSIPGAVERCTRILWHGKALEKTRIRVFSLGLREISQNAEKKEKHSQDKFLQTP
jgi:hypothetical protein